MLDVHAVFPSVPREVSRKVSTVEARAMRREAFRALWVDASCRRGFGSAVDHVGGTVRWTVTGRDDTDRQWEWYVQV